MGWLSARPEGSDIAGEPLELLEHEDFMGYGASRFCLR